MKILFSFLVLVSSLALAQVTPPSAVLTWSAPTSYIDGTPITLPITYNIYQGSSATTLVKVASGVTALTNTITTGLTDGATYYWSVTAVVSGVESVQAAPVSKIFPAGTPGTVISLTVK